MAIEPIPPSTSASEAEAHPTQGLPPATGPHVFFAGNDSMPSMAAGGATQRSDTPLPLRTVDPAILSNWDQPQPPLRRPFFINDPPASPPFPVPAQPDYPAGGGFQPGAFQGNAFQEADVGVESNAEVGAVGVTAAIGRAAGVGAAEGVGASIVEGVGDTKGARTSVLNAEAGQYRLEGQASTLTISRTPITVIGKAVRNNKVGVQFAALALRSSLDAKLEQMRADRSNSDDPALYENLKRRVDDFLIASESDDEEPAVAATLSLSEGLRNWWTTEHSSICNKTLNMGLFAGGLAICALAGALGPVGVVTVGTLIGGKDVASALESCVKMLAKRD